MVKAKTIKKIDLVEKIYVKTNGEVPRVILSDVIDNILEFMIHSLEKEEVVSIKNFGTFHTFYTVPHSKKVKFSPHNIFKGMIAEKRDWFLQK